MEGGGGLEKGGGGGSGPLLELGILLRLSTKGIAFPFKCTAMNISTPPPPKPKRCLAIHCTIDLWVCIQVFARCGCNQGQQDGVGIKFLQI